MYSFLESSTGTWPVNEGDLRVVMYVRTNVGGDVCGDVCDNDNVINNKIVCNDDRKVN